MKRLLFLLICFVFPEFVFCQDLVITGIGDGNYTGKALKFIELHANKAIDLDDYVIKIFSNGQVSPSLTIDLGTVIMPSDVAAGSRIFLRNGSDVSWNNLFNCEHDFSSPRKIVKKSFVSFNGNDVISLELKTGQQIDLFGRIGEVNSTDDYSVDWNYQDGWAYRLDKTSSDGTFNLNHWIIRPASFPTDLSVSNCVLGADRYPFAAYILPIQFIDVSVSNIQSQPMIQWSVSPQNEQVQSFEIQYSYDGFIFYPQFVKFFQKGVLHYSTVLNRNNQPVYYRVKVNAKTGVYFSTILRVVNEQKNSTTHFVYDARQKLIKQLGEPKLIILYDFSGQVYRVSSQKNIDVSFLESGLYILKTKLDAQRITIIN